MANIPTVIIFFFSDLIQLHSIRSFSAAFRDLKSSIFSIKCRFGIFFTIIFFRQSILIICHFGHLSFSTLFLNVESRSTKAFPQIEVKMINRPVELRWVSENQPHGLMPQVMRRFSLTHPCSAVRFIPDPV